MYCVFANDDDDDDNDTDDRELKGDNLLMISIMT
jgi:hypothetical protein